MDYRRHISSLAGRLSRRLRGLTSSPYGCYTAVVVAMMTGLIMVFKDIILVPGAISFTTSFIASLADAMLVFLPMIWLRGRWRYAVIVPLLMLPLLMWANVMYFRNFDDLIPGTMYSLEFASNDFVMQGAVATIELFDLLWLLVPLFLIAVLVRYRRAIIPAVIGFRAKTVYVSLLALMIAATMLLGVRRVGVLRGLDNTRDKVHDYFELWSDHTSWSVVLLNFGVTGYAVRAMQDYFDDGIDLDAEQRAMIEQTFGRTPGDLPDSLAAVFAGNSDKNLIVIVVESLNSSALTLPQIGEIAPNLTEMLADSLTVSALNVEVQAGPGRSADGQFIINTGMLPLQSEALVAKYAHAAYPSVAKALAGHYAAEVICESRTLWNHGLTTISYGFDSLADGVCSMISSDKDMKMLDFAATHTKELPHPYFLFVTTMTMHDPYNGIKGHVPERAMRAIEGIAEECDRYYLAALAHFDYALGEFIAKLRESGDYANSVILITGDHEARRKYISPLLQDTRVPLIILNSGYGARLEQTLCQADIFPAVLDVMGVGDYRPEGCGFTYRGLGSSPFRSPYHRVDAPDWEASSLAIRGRYFK